MMDPITKAPIADINIDGGDTRTISEAKLHQCSGGEPCQCARAEAFLRAGRRSWEDHNRKENSDG
jgi:hypothetical protein